ncbi:MAG: SAM-dependent DNA methyltransferase [Synergistaceae bacterium]|nr:SAM-dependent DNA methyltransferase [Synergistaceae bacterium]
MDTQNHSSIANFIWQTADDCLRDVYVRGKYRDVILPMTVIRRLDSLLEGTKDKVLAMKARLEQANITETWPALCAVTGYAFCNASPFTLRDIAGRTQSQKLASDFTDYLDGFSPEVQDILTQFKFRDQIPTMTRADILGAVIAKFMSPEINLSPNPVCDDDGNILLPGLDNHGMGMIFEELIRRFNEENNEEAGEHWTPRDVVELMSDLVFVPVADKIQDTIYMIYDGACGTGGMLTLAEEKLAALAGERGKSVSVHVFGQEINAETYAIAKADLLLKGSEESRRIKLGSTLTEDQYKTDDYGEPWTFDFMLSNPPYGKSWKNDADKLGSKNGITDSRFTVTHKGQSLSMIPRTSDGQLLFLLNNIAKMKPTTPLGSRIAEVHNGSSIFTGDAGSGESNARRYIIENDLLEAVIAVPENMFYNTGIGTFIWILSNKKEARRKGKIQLIDATAMKSLLRKNLGSKNCEFSPEIRAEILRVFMSMEESDISRVFSNDEFGYWSITVLRPQYDSEGEILRDKKGRPVADKDLTDTEIVPFTYPGGIDAFMRDEVLRFAPDAYIDRGKTQIGYEIPFTKYFYRAGGTRSVGEILADLRELEEHGRGIMSEIEGDVL